MDTEDKEMLTNLLNSGKLPPYCEEAFSKWLDGYKERPISTAMRDWAKREEVKIRGIKGERYEPTTKYDNCELESSRDGTYIMVAERRMGQVVTKKEGVTILAWLTRALDDLIRVPTTSLPKRQPVTEPSSFDKEYGFVEDNRETNQTIDSSTGEAVTEEPFEVDEENPF